MLANVQINRILGRKVPRSERKQIVGKLLTKQITVGIRTAIALRLVDTDGQQAAMDLYEPKLTLFTGKTLTFVGMECIDGAWMAQEWVCELTHEEDVAGFG